VVKYQRGGASCVGKPVAPMDHVLYHNTVLCNLTKLGKIFWFMIMKSRIKLLGWKHALKQDLQDEAATHADETVF
jgi:hypothetical protein